MVRKIGGWYTPQEDLDRQFAELVADIYEQKLAGTYQSLEPKVIGGWYVSSTDKEILRAEEIADAVIERSKKKKGKK